MHGDQHTSAIWGTPPGINKSTIQIAVLSTLRMVFICKPAAVLNRNIAGRCLCSLLLLCLLVNQSHSYPSHQPCRGNPQQTPIIGTHSRHNTLPAAGPTRTCSLPNRSKGILKVSSSYMMMPNE